MYHYISCKAEYLPINTKFFSRKSQLIFTDTEIPIKSDNARHSVSVACNG